MPARAGNASVDALHIHPPSEEINGVRKDIKVVSAELSRSVANGGGQVKPNPPIHPATVGSGWGLVVRGEEICAIPCQRVARRLVGVGVRFYLVLE